MADSGAASAGWGARTAFAGGTDRRTETPLVDRTASRLGFDRVAAALSRTTPFAPVRPSVAYVLAAVCFDAVVVQAIRMATGRQHILVESPSWITIPLGVVFGVYGIEAMYDGYDRALDEARLGERVADEAVLRPLVPRWLRGGIVAVGLLLYGALFVVNDMVGYVLLVDGPVAGAIAWGVLFPLVYLPIAAEFTATFVAVQFLLPRRLVRADLSLDFLDPEGLGGLRPVGELLKRSYYIFAGGVVIYLTSTYAPVVFAQWTATRYPDPGAFAAAFFTVVWVLGIAAIGHSMTTMHRHMRREKRDRLLTIRDHHREVIDSPDDITQASIADEDTFSDVEFRTQQVRATSEYPATLTMWSHIVVSVLVPKAIQMALTAM